MHGLVEFDATCARAAIHRHKTQTGESLSFTAFMLACLGKAIDANKHLHVYRSWRNQLILFEEVDAQHLVRSGS